MSVACLPSLFGSRPRRWGAKNRIEMGGGGVEACTTTGRKLTDAFPVGVVVLVHLEVFYPARADVVLIHDRVCDKISESNALLARVIEVHSPDSNPCQPCLHSVDRVGLSGACGKSGGGWRYTARLIPCLERCVTLSPSLLVFATGVLFVQIVGLTLTMCGP